MNKIIILFSMFTYDEYQQGISNTNSHIYNWLKKFNNDSKIIFVDFNRYGFTNKLKYVIKHVLQKQPSNTIISTLFNKLTKIDDQCLVYKGVSFNELFKYLNNSEFEKIEVWSFNPFIDKYKFNNTNIKKYFYTIDDWRMNNVFKKHTKLLKSNYDNIPNQFDHVFINNKLLISKLYNNQKNIHYIPNGVDVEYYRKPNQTPAIIKNKIDLKLGSIPTLIIGYLGVISPDRIDFNLVEYIIKNNPNLYFIFAGPVLTGFNDQLLTSKYNNLKFIGIMYFQEFSYLLSKYDVCIIPHQLNEFVQSMDPKKLYEYLAAGKPIVTTPVSGTENFKKFIYIAATQEEFSNNINLAIKQNSDQKKADRQTVVVNHDWNYRFKDIEAIISI